MKKDKTNKKKIDTFWTEPINFHDETDGFFPHEETVRTDKIENNKSDTLLNLKNELLNSFHDEITDFINRSYNKQKRNHEHLNVRMSELHGVTIPLELLDLRDDINLGNLLVIIRRGVDRLEDRFDELIDLYSTEVVYN